MAKVSLFSKHGLRSALTKGPFTFQTLQDLRLEFYLLRLRWNNRLNPLRQSKIKKFQAMSNVKLHWGCGSRILDGWVNIDGFPAKGIDFMMDLRGQLPFRDNSVQYIFTEHVLEHLTEDHGAGVLQEFYRVLQPGGTARIIVPSLRSFCEHYLQGDQDYFESTGTAQAEDLPSDGLNSLFYNHFHRCMYDYARLDRALRRAGFPDVRESSHLGSNHNELNLDTDSESRRLASLYVEATKT